MKIAWLMSAIVVTVVPCSAKPSLHRVQLTLRYEMKQSLSSVLSSSKSIRTSNHFTLSLSDSFYAVIDPASGNDFEPLATKTRKWKGETRVTGSTESIDEEGRLKCDVSGGRALKLSEMPTLALSPATMGTGQSLAVRCDFPVNLAVQTVVTSSQGNLTSGEAAPGAVPLCLESSDGAVVFRQTIEANPPLSRRPKDALGARIYDSLKGSQSRGEFWLSSPAFYELKRSAPGLYTLEETQAFPFKPSKTETQNWTQSLSLKLAILPP